MNDWRNLASVSPHIYTPLKQKGTQRVLKHFGRKHAVLLSFLNMGFFVPIFTKGAINSGAAYITQIA